jgi:hypothetical protein
MVIDVYAQGGLLLIKSGVIRSGGAAPVDNVEQYLAWRKACADSPPAFAI